MVINLRFPGQYYDAESGLFQNWHRYYDPTLGRYISSDPIGLLGGMNTFGYVYQNPLKYIDPLGLNPLAGFTAGEMLNATLASALIYYTGSTLGGNLYDLTHSDSTLNNYGSWDDEGEDGFVPRPKPRPKPQPKPKNCPAGTKPIDQMGWPRDKTHKIKDGLGLGATDWTGITPDGKIIVTGKNGEAEELGHESNFE